MGDCILPAHRKDFSLAVEAYGVGASIEEVANMFAVSRQAMWKILTRRGVEMRQPNLQPFVEWMGRKFTLRENGYYAETSGDREYLHRAMWAAAYGPIPEGYEVHHKDEDKRCNALDNFELLTSSEHGRRHGFRGNQYVGKSCERPSA